MESRATTAAKFFLLVILLVPLAGVYSLYYLLQPTPMENNVHVVIRKGTRSQDVAQQLGTAGVVRLPELFYVTQYALGNHRKFKAGEYMFPAHISPWMAARKLVKGDVVVRKITIPEGWNMREIRAAIQAEAVLEGELTRPMPEGSILPQTYHFIYGDTRNALAARMQAAMTKALDEAWGKRTPGLPLRNKDEALVLASIVEKETGLPQERRRVAAVFINRLNIGMRLQTDPSVIYGIEQKTGEPLGRPLTTADLETPSPYNTYLNPGLPPAPIASPGKESIEAALHPDPTDDLYFVAIGDGSGGHRFASTLDEHNKNVAAYRAALANAAR